MPNFVQVYRDSIKKNVWVRPEHEGQAPYRSLCTSCLAKPHCRKFEGSIEAFGQGVIAAVYECPDFQERVDADAAH